MATLVAGHPSNLHLPRDARAVPIDADLYDICSRVQELSPKLQVVLLEDDKNYCWAVMEEATNGDLMLVKKFKELDGRVIQELQKMLHTPLQERIKILEAQAEKDRAAYLEEQSEELYETMGRPMWTELEKAGFIQRGVSYPKTGAVGGKGSKEKSK